MSKTKYKIRYRDNMTTYLIDMVFNSKEKAEYYIECNLGESSLYEVETTNHDIETVAEIFFESPDNISSFKGCIEMAETLKEEDRKEFNELLADNSLLKEKTNENL